MRNKHRNIRFTMHFAPDKLGFLRPRTSIPVGSSLILLKNLDFFNDKFTKQKPPSTTDRFFAFLRRFELLSSQVQILGLAHKLNRQLRRRLNFWRAQQDCYATLARSLRSPLYCRTSLAGGSNCFLRRFKSWDLHIN